MNIVWCISIVWLVGGFHSSVVYMKDHLNWLWRSSAAVWWRCWYGNSIVKSVSYSNDQIDYIESILASFLEYKIFISSWLGICIPLIGIFKEPRQVPWGQMPFSVSYVRSEWSLRDLASAARCLWTSWCECPVRMSDTSLSSQKKL